MRCYSCNKEFDYEKYYGICPKCGCYNKKVTPQEQHQQYHDQYDGGYRHREETHTASTGRNAQQSGGYGYGQSQGYVQVMERQDNKGGTAFLLLSVVFLILAVLFGTLGETAYKDHLEAKTQAEDMEQKVTTVSHELGEAFLFQGLTLKVEEVRTLADWEELDIPQGKKLVAVKISGSGDGEWADYNKIRALYIRCEGICYPQISDYEFEGIGEVYRTPSLELSAFCWEEEAEGWIAFLVEEDAKVFTMCMEDRVEKDLVFIETIHSFEIELEEESHE